MPHIQPSSTHRPASQRPSGRPSAPASALSALVLLCLGACNPSCKSELTVTYEHADTGPHPPPLPVATSNSYLTPEQALEAYEHFKGACIRKDAGALWEMLADSTKEEFGAAASRLRELGSADLKSVFGYTGPLNHFTAFELHRADLTRPLHLCSDAKDWHIGAHVQRGLEHVLVVERGNNSRMELFLQRNDHGAIRARSTPWFTAP